MVDDGNRMSLGGDSSAHLHIQRYAIKIIDGSYHELSTVKCFEQVKGKVNGQTVLPMPVGVELVHEAEKEVLRGQEVDLYLKSAIEGVVIKWAQQINDVMMEDSSMSFENGQNPLPTAGEYTYV